MTPLRLSLNDIKSTIVVKLKTKKFPDAFSPYAVPSIHISLSTHRPQRFGICTKFVSQSKNGSI